MYGCEKDTLLMVHLPSGLHALISTLKSAAKPAFDLNPRAGPTNDIYQLITSVTSCNIKLISIFDEECMRCHKLDVIRVGHSTETMCYSINLMIVTQCDILRCSDDWTNMRKCCVQCSSCCISIHFPWCTFLFFISCLMMIRHMRPASRTHCMDPPCHSLPHDTDHPTLYTSSIIHLRLVGHFTSDAYGEFRMARSTTDFRSLRVSKNSWVRFRIAYEILRYLLNLELNYFTLVIEESFRIGNIQNGVVVYTSRIRGAISILGRVREVWSSVSIFYLVYHLYIYIYNAW